MHHEPKRPMRYGQSVSFADQQGWWLSALNERRRFGVGSAVSTERRNVPVCRADHGRPVLWEDKEILLRRRAVEKDDLMEP